MLKQTTSTVLGLGLLLFAPGGTAGAVDRVHYDAQHRTVLLAGRQAAERDGADDASVVREVAVGSSTDRVLWRGDGPVFDVTSSPTGTYVACREKVWVEDVRPTEASYVSRSRTAEGERESHHLHENEVLRILDRSGELVRSVDRVRRYVWSPDGEKVAYVAGDYYEGGVGFTNPRTFVLEVASGETRELGIAGFDLHWATFDGRLYVRRIVPATEARVVRYDPDTGAVEATAHRGIHFSPDGSLYYAAPSEGLPFRLYRSADDREITAESPFLESFPFGNVQARGWYGETTLVIAPSLPGQGGDLVYRLGEPEASRVDGRVLALLEGGAEVLLSRDGEVAVEPLAAFERVQEVRPAAGDR